MSGIRDIGFSTVVKWTGDLARDLTPQQLSAVNLVAEYTAGTNSKVADIISSPMRRVLIGGEQFGDILMRQLRFRFVGGSSPKNVRIIPETFASIDLPNGPNSGRTLDALRGWLDLAGNDWRRVKGVNVSTGKSQESNLRGSVALDLITAFDSAPEWAYLRSYKELGGTALIRDDVTAVIEVTPGALPGVGSASDGWMTLEGSGGDAFQSWVTGKTIPTFDSRVGTRRSLGSAQFVHMMRHESEHLLQPLQGDEKIPIMIFEGAAELRTRATGELEHSAQKLGIALTESDVSELRSGLEDHRYNPAMQFVGELLNRAGIKDTVQGAADVFHAHRDKTVLRRLARGIIREQKLSKRAEPDVVRLIENSRDKRMNIRNFDRGIARIRNGSTPKTKSSAT